MKVIRIEPQGYCGGVIKALEKVNDAINNPNIAKPIYLLGNIIHNKHVVDDFINKGIIVVDDKNKTRLELLDEITSGTVIFSAHGVVPKVYEKAKAKGLNIIDATCPNVLIVHNKIKEHLEKGYEIIYIGTKNHPECEGVLGISNKIHFITSIADINSLQLNSNLVYATSQTTLSIYDIEDIFKALKDKYPSIETDDKICNATTIRQKALANQEKVDLCIIVGDANSSNTKKLAKVAEDYAHIKTILIDGLKGLDKEILKGISSVSVSSGASTPSYLVDEVIEYLTKL